MTACALAGVLALGGCDTDGPATPAPTGAPTSGAPVEEDDTGRTAAATDADTHTGGTGAPPELGAGALLTNTDAGALVRLSPGEEVVLRLTPPLQGDEPDVADPEVVEVVPVQHFADPGYAEYELLALAPGRTTVSVAGTDGSTLLALVLVQSG